MHCTQFSILFLKHFTWELFYIYQMSKTAAENAFQSLDVFIHLLALEDKKPFSNSVCILVNTGSSLDTQMKQRTNVRPLEMST